MSEERNSNEHNRQDFLGEKKKGKTVGFDLKRGIAGICHVSLQERTGDSVIHYVLSECPKLEYKIIGSA